MLFSYFWAPLPLTKPGRPKLCNWLMIFLTQWWSCPRMTYWWFFFTKLRFFNIWFEKKFMNKKMTNTEDISPAGKQSQFPFNISQFHRLGVQKIFSFASECLAIFELKFMSKQAEPTGRRPFNFQPFRKQSHPDFYWSYRLWSKNR